MDASKPVVAEKTNAADADNLSTAQGNISPECSSSGNPSTQGSSARKSLRTDYPSPRGSCVDSGSCSSAIKGLDKKPVSVKPSVMKKPGSVVVSAGGVVMKKCTRSVFAGVTISVSHTEKETVVHTDTSNFREVVHQLTSASRSDDVLLPVTITSRSRGLVEDVSGCLTRHDFSSRGTNLGRSVPSRLFERRRSSKTLERLSTSCKELPPLVPSPVTPLASDFERICLPVTPLVSPAAGPENELSKQQAAIALQPRGGAQSYANLQQLGLHIRTGLEESHLISERPHPLVDVSELEVHSSCGGQQEKSFEDLVIAEKGFFLHPRRPGTSEPALLPLFPESPKDR